MHGLPVADLNHGGFSLSNLLLATSVEEGHFPERPHSPARVLTLAEFGVACGSGAGFQGKAPREGARWLSRLRLPRGVLLPRRWRPPVGTIQAFDPWPLHWLFITGAHG